jgi:exodeoxyribonuclease VII large subunit
LDSYTLLELNRYIRRVVALNFQEPLWVEGEIAQCNTSKGHYFLDLIQKDPETEAILAWMPAIMWQRRALQIQRKLSTAFHLILKEGNAVRLKVQPEFDERYGLKLQLLDLDTEYSLGQLALEREKVIQQLARQGLFERNRALSLAPVMQRRAVRSSPEAAGYAAFSRPLQQNELG